MAIYHLSVQRIKRSVGHSAVAAAAYRSGEKLNDLRRDQTHDYTRKQSVDYTAILAPDNAPSWMSNREELWNGVETCERRKKAQVAREFNIALPKELSLDEQKKLVHGFCEQEFVRKGFVADIAIHDAEGKNPHAHVMIPMRHVDPENKYGFGTKAVGSVSRYFDTKPALFAWRESWKDHANNALEAANSNERIDHRTLEAQGIHRRPTQHMGKQATGIERRGERSRRGDANIIVKQMNFVTPPRPKNRSQMEKMMDDIGRRYYQAAYGSREAYGDLYDMDRDFYGREPQERGYER